MGIEAGKDALEAFAPKLEELELTISAVLSAALELLDFCTVALEFVSS